MEHVDRMNMFGEKCRPCNSCYATGCRCCECKIEGREYRHRLRRLKEPGWDNPMISSLEVRAHIRELFQQKMGVKLIAKQAGLDTSTVQYIMRDGVGAVRKQTADKILAVVMSDEWTPAVSVAQRKLFEVGLEGVALTVVAKETGLSIRNLSDIRRGLPSKIRRSTFDKIMAFDPKKFPRDKRVANVTRQLKKRFDDEQQNTPKVRINSKRHKVPV